MSNVLFCDGRVITLEAFLLNMVPLKIKKIPIALRVKNKHGEVEDFIFEDSI